MITPALRNTSGVMVVSPSSGQLLQIHDVEFLAEDVGEAALGHAAMQWHLAAFKAAHHARTAARTLAFVSAGRGLAHARTHAAADALLVFRRLLWCANVGKIHNKLSARQLVSSQYLASAALMS